MRKSLRAITVLAVIAAWAVLPGSAAQAALYHFMACQPGTTVYGSFTTLTATMTPSPNLSPHTIAITGTMAPCHTPSTLDVFAVAAYRTDGPAYGNSHQYSSVHSTFTMKMRVTPLSHAICLLSNPTTRLDCYSLVWATNPSTGALEHSIGASLPIDSPLVQASPWVNMTPYIDEQPDPGCMTCGDGGDD